MAEEEEYSGSGEFSDEEEDDKEPKLKYQRLGAKVPEILKTEKATCMGIHSKFLALGTDKGVVYFLAINGDVTQRFQCHDQPVKEISIDRAGEFVASCSFDGKVVITSLSDKSIVKEHIFNRALSTVAIDPEYSKNNKERFVCGGKAGKLMFSEKGWFGSSVSFIYEGDSGIHAIAWGTGFVAWSNDTGTRIWDSVSRDRMTSPIMRPAGTPKSENCRCCLSWENENTLIIGWGETVVIGQVKERLHAEGGLPSLYFDQQNCIAVKGVTICGVAPFETDLIVMAHTGAEAGKSRIPELRIMSRQNNEELSIETLSIHNYDKYNAMDYRLDHLAQDALFYLVSPGDIVIAKPRDVDDRVSWYLTKRQFEEALAIAEEGKAELRKYKLQDLGEKLLSYYLENGQVEKVEANCEKILGTSAALWEKWIFDCSKKKMLQAIGLKIPTNNPRLSKMLYELVLKYFLDNDCAIFFKLIESWPQDVYSIPTIINAVVIVPLMKFDPQKATELLIANVSRIPVSRVVSQLESEPQLQLIYLDNLFFNKKDQVNQEGKDYHNLQVSLYANYDREHLYEFLEKSIYWDLDKALDICKQKELWREVVFIYGRMGNIEEALKLMIEKVGDVKQAIEFVQKQNEEPLWDDLISKSIRNPVFVSGLLENVGTHINPLKLIEKIPKGMEIIGLRYRLVKIINDYLLQTSLSQGCCEVLKADVITLSNRLFKGNCRAIRVEQDARCTLSNASILNTTKKKNVVIFFCNHMYYEDELVKLSGQTQIGKQKQYICPTCKQNAENNNLSTDKKQRLTRK